MGQSALCGRDSTPCSRRGAPGAWSGKHTAAQLASGAASGGRREGGLRLFASFWCGRGSALPRATSAGCYIEEAFACPAGRKIAGWLISAGH